MQSTKRNIEAFVAAPSLWSANGNAIHMWTTDNRVQLSPKRQFESRFHDRWQGDNSLVESNDCNRQFVQNRKSIWEEKEWILLVWAIAISKFMTMSFWFRVMHNKQTKKIENICHRKRSRLSEKRIVTFWSIYSLRLDCNLFNLGIVLFVLLSTDQNIIGHWKKWLQNCKKYSFAVGCGALELQDLHNFFGLLFIARMKWNECEHGSKSHSSYSIPFRG